MELFLKTISFFLLFITTTFVVGVVIMYVLILFFWTVNVLVFSITIYASIFFTIILGSFLIAKKTIVLEELKKRKKEALKEKNQDIYKRLFDLFKNEKLEFGCEGTVMGDDAIFIEFKYGNLRYFNVKRKKVAETYEVLFKNNGLPITKARIEKKIIEDVPLKNIRSYRLNTLNNFWDYNKPDNLKDQSDELKELLIKYFY